MEIEFTDNYPDLYRKAINSPEDLNNLFEKTRNEENKFRELFAKKRESEVLKDDKLMLVNAFENFDIFKGLPETEDEKKIPRAFPNEKPVDPKVSNINTKKDFLNNFLVYSERQLDYLDWNNVLVAGGAVLACLQPIPEEHNVSNLTRRKYYHDLQYNGGDIDIFIYGLDEEAANEKIKSIYSAIVETIPFKAICFRTRNSVSIISQYPFRTIQIILRLYKSPAEVLMGFDIDSSSVGYDGKDVYMTPRAHRAIVKMQNTVDMSRRSPTYEKRLAKYATRGFSILIPFLDRTKIDPQIYEKRSDRLHGLARLLLFEKMKTSSDHTLYREFQRLKKLRPQSNPGNMFWGRLNPQLNDKPYCDIDENSDESDYSTVCFGWGREWTADKIQKLMYKKDFILNSEWYDPDKKIHTHPCFFGTAEQILGNCCDDPKCGKVNPDEYFEEGVYVYGELKWKVVDPGEQRIGSFHPITDEDWVHEAYVLTDFSELCQAVIENDSEKLKTLIEKGVDVNQKDYIGRSPLHLAIYHKSIDCLKILLDHGAKISYRIIDGRTSLHLAVQYGETEIVKLLLAKLAEIKEKSESEKEKTMEDEDDDDDSDGQFSLKKLMERKKLEQEKKMMKYDPSQKVFDEEFDIDSKCWDLQLSCLHYAIFFGHLEIVKLLIETGKADIKKMVIFKQNDQVVTQYSVLDLAMIARNYEMCKFLLELGADPNQKDISGNGSLHRAANMLDLPYIELLINWSKDSNTEIDLLNNQFQTPIDLIIPSLNGRLNSLTLSSEKKIEEEDLSKQYDLTDEENDCHQHYLIIKYLLENTKMSGFYDLDFYPKKFFRARESPLQQLKSRNTQPNERLINTQSLQLVQLFIEHGMDVNWIYGYRQNTISDNWDSVVKNFKSQLETYQRENLEDKEEVLSQIEKAEKELENYEKDSFAYNELKWYIDNSLKSQNPMVRRTKRRMMKHSFFHSRASKGRRTNAKKQNPLNKLLIQLGLELENEKDEQNEIEIEMEDEKEEEEDPLLLKLYTMEENEVYRKQQEIEKKLNSLTKEEKNEINTHNRLIMLKFQLKRAEEIENVIKKEGGKKFVELDLTKTKFEELIDIQEQKKKNPNQQQSYYGGRRYRNSSFGAYSGFNTGGSVFGGLAKKKKLTGKKGVEVEGKELLYPIRIFGLVEQFPENYQHEKCFPETFQNLYLELFSAVLNSDFSKVEELTIQRQEKGLKPCVIACRSEFSRRTPLHVAFEKGDEKMLKRLIEISILQFTPLDTSIKDKDEYVPKINNRDLMMNVSTRSQIGRTGKIKYKSFDQTMDLETEIAKMTCVVSPLTLFKYCNAHSHTIFLLAIAKGPIKLLASLIELLSEWNDNKEKYTYDFDEDIKPEENILQSILARNTRIQNFNPFEIAVAVGNMESVKLLLENGGIVLKSREKQLTYKGLKMGDEKKKQQWTNSMVNMDYDKKRTSLHVAAFYNQPAVLEFLVTKAKKIWEEKFGHMTDKFFPPNDFDLYYLPSEKQKYSIMHYATQNESPEVIQKIIDLDTEKKLIGSQTLQGATPMMVAAGSSHLESLKVLFENKANLEATSQNGWNVLHYAVVNDDLKIVKYLLKHINRKVANQPSNGFLYTPLMFAAYASSNDCLIHLIHSDKVDLHALDLYKNSAAHYALFGANIVGLKLLVPQNLKDYSFYKQENAVGMTLLDYIRVKLSTIFQQDPNMRRYNSNNVTKLDEKTVKIHEYLKSLLDFTRTRIDLQSTLLTVEVVTEKLKKDLWNQYNFLKHMHNDPQLPTIYL
ncbi:ankyrin repeat ph and sec7 domain containing protein secg-related [Anaeramoeba flamelloides]|uniref:Ankyrin repeat ph and sec7 domain containing protein secg-related n=1 Tax=Anaeramoeba flamelloides TaxID=1746091 RepID=A0AAV7ZNQ0_9EUKA|nr:ankyrin repeat ph and sec7 domain containing protein secg-related [Anaeramoeba flamelloides]|eukprot:Anaeramoba_flamelloidesa325390_1179.p1 GENE.a325390_1179~~a325390_1179.p1  ORF type:complete len:1773 (-),score=503.89 a325390_1179:260-5578(-)